MGVWWLILCIRHRPLSDHVAFMAASLFPFLLSVIGATLFWVDVLDSLSRGWVGPGNPGQARAQTLGHAFGLLFEGSALTLLFLTLGIFVLVIRRPK